MEWSLPIIITSFLVGIFIVIGLWQRNIGRLQDRSIQEQPQGRGRNGPIAQHPQINPYRCLGCSSCVHACPEKGALAVVHGVACLVNPSRCVGHGDCERACPVGALTVGLGDTSHRSDLPVLSPELETSVPGVFIAGELGGIALIRHAVEQGRSVVEVIAQRLHHETTVPGHDNLLDVLIVGCGPAGISAALKATECGLHYAVIDQNDLGGTVRKYPRNKLTMTQPVDLPLFGRMKRTQYTKEELIELWEEIFAEKGISVRSGVRLTGLERVSTGLLQVETSEGPLCCRTVVLALGRRGTPRALGVPGEDSERVLYELTDAASHAHEDLLVVGGGDSAIEAAAALAVQPGNRVTLSYRREAFFRLKERNLQRIEALQEDGRLEVLLNTQVTCIGEGYAILQGHHPDRLQETQVPADYVFVLAGGEPPYPLLKGMGVAFGGEAEEKTPSRVSAGPAEVQR